MGGIKTCSRDICRAAVEIADIIAAIHTVCFKSHLDNLMLEELRDVVAEG